MVSINEHKRVNDCLSNFWEYPVLQFFVRHLPAWVSPLQLTILGFFGSVIFFVVCIASRNNINWLFVAMLGVIIHWFGDSTDGSLARYRKIPRPRFGFFIDHTLDMAAATLFALGLGLTSEVTFSLGALALIGYLLISCFTYIKALVLGEFKITQGKIGPTEVRMLILLILFALYRGGVPELHLWKDVNLVDLSLFSFFVLLVLIFAVSIIIEGRELAKLDPEPTNQT